MADETTQVDVAESSPAAAEVESTPEESGFESWSKSDRDTFLTTGKLPQAKPEVSPPPAAEKSSEPEEAENSAVSEPAQRGEESPKPKANAETRKRQLAAEIQSLLEQRRALRVEVEAAKATGAPPAVPPTAEPQAEAQSQSGRPVRPKLGDFEDYDAYENAMDAYEESLADWKAAARIEREKQQYMAEQQAQSQMQRNQEIRTNWERRLAETRKRAPDFDTVVVAGEIPLNPVMDGFVLDSEVGPDLVYYLAKHQDEAARIAGLPAFATTRELARIEMAIQQGIQGNVPASPQQTGAKPPPTELSGRNAAPVDEVAAAAAAGDFRRYMAAANARDMARMKRA